MVIEVAPETLQERIAVCPSAMLVGLAVKDEMVGAGLGAGFGEGFCAGLEPESTTPPKSVVQYQPYMPPATRPIPIAVKPGFSMLLRCA